jgi:hypothetical protein
VTLQTIDTALSEPPMPPKKRSQTIRRRKCSCGHDRGHDFDNYRRLQPVAA